ncbi:MAG: hypothetical protein ABWW69_00375 [Pyrodictiaceae archaeon]
MTREEVFEETAEEEASVTTTEEAAEETIEEEAEAVDLNVALLEMMIERTSLLEEAIKGSLPVAEAAKLLAESKMPVRTRRTKRSRRAEKAEKTKKTRKRRKKS